MDWSSVASTGISQVGGFLSEMFFGKKNRDFTREERERQNEWNLQMWNAENEYNSASAQKARLEAAGYSPLALLNGGQNMGNASALTASDATMPAMNNPISGDSIANSYAAFKNAKLAEKKTDAEIKLIESQAGKANEEAETERQIREDKVEFAGVQVKLGNKEVEEKEANIKLIAQKINESQAQVDQIMEYANLLGVQVSNQKWLRFVAERKLPKEMAILGYQVIAAKYGKNSSIYQAGLYQQEYNKGKYYLNNNYYAQDLNYNYQSQKNSLKSQGLGLEQQAGQTYSPFGYAVQRGIKLTTDVISMFGDVFGAFVKREAGIKLRNSNQAPASTANPSNAFDESAVGLGGLGGAFGF